MTESNDYTRQFAAMGGQRERQHARTPHRVLVSRIAVSLVLLTMVGVIVWHSLSNAW